MCEPLRGKKLTFKIGDVEENLAFRFDDVKSAVEFYKKYESNFQMFYESYENDCKDFLINRLNFSGENLYYVDDVYIHNNEKKLFNDWLFDYCFGDVIE